MAWCIGCTSLVSHMEIHLGYGEATLQLEGSAQFHLSMVVANRVFIAAV